MKRALFISLGVLALVACIVGSIALRKRQEARRLREALANVNVASCPRAISLGDLCGRCVAAYCCKEIDACEGVDDCIDLNDCSVNCGEDEDENDKLSKPECRSACAKKHPASVTAFTAWDDCSLSHCSSVCPRSPKD